VQSITSARFVCAECDPVFDLCAACFVSGVELRDVGHLVAHRYAVAPTLAMPIVPSYVSVCHTWRHLLLLWGLLL
jgi:hypothetical protein